LAPPVGDGDAMAKSLDIQNNRGRSLRSSVMISSATKVNAPRPRSPCAAYRPDAGAEGSPRTAQGARSGEPCSNRVQEPMKRQRDAVDCGFQIGFVAWTARDAHAAFQPVDQLENSCMAGPAGGGIRGDGMWPAGWAVWLGWRRQSALSGPGDPEAGI